MHVEIVLTIKTGGIYQVQPQQFTNCQRFFAYDKALKYICVSFFFSLNKQLYRQHNKCGVRG